MYGPEIIPYTDKVHKRLLMAIRNNMTPEECRRLANTMLSNAADYLALKQSGNVYAKRMSRHAIFDKVFTARAWNEVARQLRRL